MEGVEASLAECDDDSFTFHEKRRPTFVIVPQKMGKYSLMMAGMWCLASGGPSSRTSDSSLSAGSATVATWRVFPCDGYVMDGSTQGSGEFVSVL